MHYIEIWWKFFSDQDKINLGRPRAPTHSNVFSKNITMFMSLFGAVGMASILLVGLYIAFNYLT